MVLQVFSIKRGKITSLVRERLSAQLFFNKGQKFNLTLLKRHPVKIQVKAKIVNYDEMQHIN